MLELIDDDDGLSVFKDALKYYVRYDAGAHLIAMRIDEISESEAKLATACTSEAMQVLFVVQKRLKAAGVDPYVTNTS